jgi:hypothetical protein
VAITGGEIGDTQQYDLGVAAAASHQGSLETLSAGLFLPTGSKTIKILGGGE